MNLLFANDRAGDYPESYYAATATLLPPFPRLVGEARADVCVVGGGFTGLSTALHLAKAGVDVVMLEAHRVGFGASGRNGGQVGSGLRIDQDEVERLYGRDDALKYWQIGEDAKALVRDLADDWRPGIAHVDWSAKGATETREYADFLRGEPYSYDQVAPLSGEEARALIPGSTFHGGLIDRGAGHIHPLKFALKLAQLAQDAGVRIFENSLVHDIRGIVRTGQGRVKAEHTVLALNGYHERLHPALSARVMPINNFIVATEPLDDPASVLAEDVAVADSKFVVNYWRLSEDNRLLFGGGESYGDRFPKDIQALVRKPMLEIYPGLRDVRIDYAWGGTLAVTSSRLPDFAHIEPGLWSASGYSGHGVALATYAGKMMAGAITGDASRFDLMNNLRPLAFPGMGIARRPLLNLAMRWFALRDQLGF